MARYLIDSHIFLWAVDAPEKLATAERLLLAEPHQNFSISVATFWELSIKVTKGTLPIRQGKGDLADNYFTRQAEIAGFDILPIDTPETEYVRRLPAIHRDPFDRILIAQAILTNRIIITRDAVFTRYPGVRVFAP